MLVLSESHRFIFIHVPKTAGGSVRACLTPYSVQPKATRFRRVLRKLHIRQAPEKAHFRSHDTVQQVIASIGRDVFDTYLDAVPSSGVAGAGRHRDARRGPA